MPTGSALSEIIAWVRHCLASARALILWSPGGGDQDRRRISAHDQSAKKLLLGTHIEVRGSPAMSIAALTEEAKRRPPKIPPLPASFQHFRRELGAQVYGAMGIGLQDTQKHAAAVLRNWEFFRAPLACVVCMHRDLGPWDAMSVGMFLQTLLLALTERGLGSCVEVSVVGWRNRQTR